MKIPLELETEDDDDVDDVDEDENDETSCGGAYCGIGIASGLDGVLGIEGGFCGYAKVTCADGTP
jgi:uncharacterized low-complexity protein